LALVWGVHPFLLPNCHSIEELIERAIVYLKEKKMVHAGEHIVVAAGEPVGEAGHLNLLEVREV
jgi:pyruvate kinase